MQITPDLLATQKHSLEEQKAKALAMTQQITGALAVIDMLINRLAEPESADKGTDDERTEEQG